MTRVNCILLFFSVLLISSCKKTDEVIDNSLEILSKSIEAYGGEDNFYNSVTTFNIDELNYNLERSGTITNYVMTRNVDTTTYKATYNNGAIAYYVNDSLQQMTAAALKFIGAKLEALTFLYSIPFNLKHNYYTKEQLQNVTINGQEYLSLKFTAKEETTPKDEIILYVHPETHLIEYICERMALNSNRLLFRKAYGSKKVNSLHFNNFEVYYNNTMNEMDITKFYQEFNNNMLKRQNDVELSNINVTIIN